jgi:two-component system chemotaxis sensor kinase CheA
VLVLDVTAIGHGAGIPRELHRPTAAAPRTVARSEREGLRVVLFQDLCGERRAIAMSAVEQVEHAPVSAVRNPGPNAQIVLGEEILTLLGVPEDAELPERLSVMRLGDGTQQIAYAARKVLDIATLSGVLKRVNGQPTVVGVTLVDGETVELVDSHALFASQATQVAGTHSLTCRLAGEDGWMRNFLGPIIEAAGYRIVDEDEPADVGLPRSCRRRGRECDARKADPLAQRAGQRRGADSIYRYDRAALMAALLRAGEELAA